MHVGMLVSGTLLGILLREFFGVLDEFLLVLREFFGYVSAEWVLWLWVVHQSDQRLQDYKTKQKLTLGFFRDHSRN